MALSVVEDFKINYLYYSTHFVISIFIALLLFITKSFIDKSYKWNYKNTESLITKHTFEKYSLLL